MSFDRFFNLNAVASRLRFSRNFLASRVAAGEFGSVVEIAGEIQLREPQVCGWLERFRLTLGAPFLVLEPFLKPSELAALHGTSSRFWQLAARAGKLGDKVVMVGSDLRIPESGYAAFLAVNARLLGEEVGSGVVARTEGELRRKLAA